jgi:phosphomannomutase
MTKIKFGTDGWRAIIDQDFTAANVARVAEATGQWLKKNFKEPSCVVGHDCRAKGELYANTVAAVLKQQGIKVFLAKGFVSTPMISMGTLELKASLGVVITASHNPPSYNGYKLKGYYGGPLVPEKIQEIENIIPDESSFDISDLKPPVIIPGPKIEYVDLEEMYCKRVEKTFDIDLIKRSGMKLAYDAMFGAGQNVIKRLFPDTLMMHCVNDTTFQGQAPEPIHKNLKELSELIKQRGDIACGLATDGDADRIGLYDSKGNFVDSHHIILLLIKYLCEEKKFTGKVVNAFSVTPRVKKMCAHFGLEYQVVKIGFKYIAGIMIEEDVLLGGEESGGIAIKGHIPERDGLWMGFVIWEYMARSGKTLEQLIEDVYKITGPFAFERNDLHLEEAVKEKIVKRCREGNIKSFGSYKVVRTEDIDGWKYFFNENEWLMIRASGTEPVLRTYAESSSRENAQKILDAAKKEMLAF